MKPALREAYTAVLKVFEEHEYKPFKKIKYSPDGNIHGVQFNNLTREMVTLTSDAVWEVMIKLEEGGMDARENLGLSYSVPVPGSLSNSGYLSFNLHWKSMIQYDRFNE